MSESAHDELYRSVGELQATCRVVREDVAKLSALLVETRRDVRRLDDDLKESVPGTGEVAILGKVWSRGVMKALSALLSTVVVLVGLLVWDWIRIRESLHESRESVAALEAWRDLGGRFTDHQGLILAECMRVRFLDRETGMAASRDLSPADPTLERQTRECREKLDALIRELNDAT